MRGEGPARQKPASDTRPTLIVPVEPSAGKEGIIKTGRFPRSERPTFPLFGIRLPHGRIGPGGTFRTTASRQLSGAGTYIQDTRFVYARPEALSPPQSRRS